MKVNITPKTTRELIKNPAVYGNVANGGLSYVTKSEYTPNQKKALKFLDSAKAYNTTQNPYWDWAVADKLAEIDKDLPEEAVADAVEQLYNIKITGKERSRYLKAIDPKRVCRKINKQSVKEAETAHYHLGYVGKNQHYASKSLINNRLEAEQKQEDYINSHFIQNKETGESIPLKDVVKTNTAKAAELYLYSKSIEKMAEESGYTYLFVTLTVPPRMHQNPSNGQDKWDGSTPEDAKNFLQEKWELIRAILHDKKIDYYGIWSREPHKDATPHQHVLIYVHPDDVQNVIDSLFVHYKMRNEAVKENLTPNGYKVFHSEKCSAESNMDIKVEDVSYMKRRLSGESIDNKKEGFQSPTSYITKYLLKSLGLESTETKNEKRQVKDSDESIAVRAAVLTWGYRRYGFFGVKSKLTLWRECRKINPENISDKGLRRLIKYSKKNDWKRFLKLSRAYTTILEHSINDVEEKVSKFIGIQNTETNETVYIKNNEWEIVKKPLTLNLSDSRNEQVRSDKSEPPIPKSA